MTLGYGPNLGLLENAATGEAHAVQLRQFLRWMDFHGQPVVTNIGLNTPPVAPLNGEAHVVGLSPVGAWGLQPNYIARWSSVSGVWELYAPKDGWEVIYDGKTYTYRTGTGWAVKAADSIDANSITGTFDTIAMDTTPASVTRDVGDVYWDADDQTLAIVRSASHTLAVGEETTRKVVNKTGAPITDGQVVCISGALGNRPKAVLANAAALATCNVIGVATETIANNAEGFVTIGGTVRSYNTSGFTAGDVLYASASTPGDLTNVAPVSPNFLAPTAIALNSTVNGMILVHVHATLALDNTLGGATPTDTVAPSQKAVKDYLDANVLHRTGNEVASGLKQFTNKTTEFGPTSASSGNGGQNVYRDDTGTARYRVGMPDTAGGITFEVYDMIAGAARMSMSGTTGATTWTVNGNAAIGMTVKNGGTGTAAETRHVLQDDAGTNVLTLTAGNTGNTASSLFGLARTAAVFMMTITNTRALVVGTFSNSSMWFGTNNVGLVEMTAAGSTRALYRWDFSRSINTATISLAADRLYFDGSADYVSIPAPSVLSSSAAFSMSTFVTADSITPATTRYIYQRYIDANSAILAYITTAGALTVRIDNGSTASGAISLVGLVTAGKVAHIGIVYDGAGSTNADRLKIYVDGALKTLTFVGTIPATTASLGSTVHTISSTTANAWAGHITDFRIYSTALTADNMLTLSNGGDFSTGCVRRYKLREGVNTVANDTGTDAQNGTVANAQWVSSTFISAGVTVARTVLSLPAGTTKDDGFSWGNDTFLYRENAGVLRTDKHFAGPKYFVTDEGGYAVRVIAGENLVRGEVVYIRQAGGTDGTVWKAPAGNDMPVGIVYASANAGAEVIIVKSGLAYVLPASTITAARGYVIFVHASEAGRVDQGSTAPVSEHWRECGHFFATGSGAGALTLAFIHFN